MKKKWCFYRQDDNVPMQPFKKIKCGTLKQLREFAKKRKWKFISEPSWGKNAGIKGYYHDDSYRYTYFTEVE